MGKLSVLRVHYYYQFLASYNSCYKISIIEWKKNSDNFYLFVHRIQHQGLSSSRTSKWSRFSMLINLTATSRSGSGL